MVALGQTITVVNQSGKIVKTSKQLVTVFNEAKSAYIERKADIKAQRKDQSSRNGERLSRNRLETLTIGDDAESFRSSRRNSDDGSRTRRRSRPKNTSKRPQMELSATDGYHANDAPSSRHPWRASTRPSPLRDESYNSFGGHGARGGELVRRHTDAPDHFHRHRAPTLARSASLDDIDMDLAYGELPPPLPERKYDTEVELRAKMGGLQRLLDECNCLQYSVTAIVDNLQKNPETLAAVALTLGEISTLASKLAPGALVSLKGSFPAIIALLLSPEFAIAAGVGVGVTIIAFGGYKIIKKIQAKKEAQRMLADGRMIAEPETPPSAMEELRELSRVEKWRRGVAQVEVESVGTSVDGEFVTPKASKALIEEGRMTEADFKSTADEDHAKKRKNKSTQMTGEGTHFSQSKTGERVRTKSESGGLRMLFKGHG